jgi:hypothetical protein
MVGRIRVVDLCAIGLSFLALAAAAGCSAASDERGAGGDLDGRVHLINQPLSVTSDRGGITTQDFAASGSSGYTYVAAVDAPANKATGDLLQATNFAFDSKYAYVTYNMAGPRVEGALEVVDLSDTTRPVLAASLVFGATEFADVALHSHYAFLVGASAADGGVLTVIDIQDAAHPTEMTTLALGSYYGTSITIQGDLAFIATGDNGGIVQVDISKPATPVIKDVVPMSNALYATHTGDKTLALGGASDTRLYSINDGAAQELALVGNEHFEAPGRMVVQGGRVFTNGAHTGLSVLNLSPDFSSAALTFHGDLPGTGNGIDIDNPRNVVVLAQGEAGTLLYDVSRPDSPALLGSFAFPDERGSANQVRFGNAANTDYVFLSDGLNGFRIIEVGSRGNGGH